jgi:hypothetical protein
MKIFIYVYYILLIVYAYEFHKMFSAVYTKRLSLVFSHVMMFGLSLIVLYQYYDNYIMYCLMWEDFAPAFMCTAIIGALIAFGGIFIHLRAYFCPQYR